MLKLLMSLIGKKGDGLGGLATDIREAIKGKEIDPNKALELVKLQNEISKVEAQHRSVFVSGWRPFIGWVCGVALAYNFIVRDLLTWFMSNYYSELGVTMPPALQMEHLMTVLLGMLGLGGLRTYEKLKDKSK
jgi:hypothetical protein